MAWTRQKIIKSPSSGPLWGLLYNSIISQKACRTEGTHPMSTQAQVLRERAIALLQRRSVPSKSQSRLSAPRFARQDNAELARHPGSSRNRTIDAIRAIAAKHTGATIITRDDPRLGRLGRLATRASRVVVVPTASTASPIDVPLPRR